MRNISHRLARTLVLASAIFLCLTASNAGMAYAQRLVYRVDLSHTARHYIDVTIQPLDIRPDTMIFQMPVWAPGIYSTVHYGRFIEGLRALDSNGKSLRVYRVNTDEWKIPNQDNVALLRYRIKDSHTDAASPELGLARIDANGVFANTEAMFGYFDNDKNIAGTIIFTMPKTWMVATTLQPATDGDPKGDSRFHQNVFNFLDYESLAQAPLLIAPKFQTRDFAWHGVGYSVVAGGSGEFPIDSFARAASHIVNIETAFFRNVPFRHYLFLIYTDPNAGEDFAIAHASSSVYSLAVMPWHEQASGTEQTIAATLFKTWNGLRFHISQLGPFDFTVPIHARSLWFSEGVSEYYAELLRVRYGLIDTPEFFNTIGGWMNAADARASGSLEVLSEQLCGNNPACLAALRARGALVALMMDIEIRDKSHGRRSLDNVLFRMDRDAPKGTTYNDSLLFRTISNYSGTNLTDFYELYIAGANPLPVEAYLEKMGAGGEVPASMKIGGKLGLDLALNAAGTAIIGATPRDSVVAEQIQCGDTVCAIDGKRVTAANLNTAETALLSGKPVKLVIVRNAKPVVVTLRARHPAGRKAGRTASRAEIRMQRAMIGKRRLPKTKSSRPRLATQARRR